MKYSVLYTSKFKKQHNKLKKQGKNLNLLYEIINKLAIKVPLDVKFRDHQLIDDKIFKNCRECHITSYWLLVYKYEEESLVLLFATGSHFEVFK